MEQIKRGSSSDKCAFSLIELLTVIVVVTIAMALIVPAINSVLTGAKVTDTATRISALIERGRMHATTSQSVVAFCILEDPSDTDAPNNYNAAGLLELKPSATNPTVLTTNMIAPVFHFPTPVVVSTSLSSALAATSGAGAGSNHFPGAGNRDYRAFLIFPDGSTSLLPSDPNPYLCVVSAADPGFQSGKPDNPYFLSIDPETGRITPFRK